MTALAYILRRWGPQVTVSLYVLAVGTLFEIMLTGGWHPTPTTFETAHELHVNHRIFADDIETMGAPHRFLSWSLATTRSFDGRYARKAFRVHEQIELEDTSPAPALHAPYDSFLYWTPVGAFAPADAASADPGASAELCALDRAERVCLTQLTIAATNCSSRDQCSAALWIPRRRRPLLLVALDEASRKDPVRSVRAFLRRPSDKKARR